MAESEKELTVLKCGPKILHLKVWPECYKNLVNGLKTFEIRKNDRDYHIGDMLVEHEWDPQIKRYTGRIICFLVSYVLEGSEQYKEMFGLLPGYCVLGLKSV